ncbi:MAG: TolC family protein [Planctomycetes bacterium]|nr:TolC family protein [Planctomycetota bacterium]
MIGDATGQGYAFVEQDSGVDARIEELMRDGLGLQDAIRICLINNPTLLAAFRNVGIARADVVQSGLFSNPTLGLLFQFPEGGGRSKIEVGLAQNIVDLWQIPIRKRVAQAGLNQAILDLAMSAAELVADTKTAYSAAVANAQILVINEENLKITQQLLQAAEDRERAGRASLVDVNLAREPVLTARVRVHNARLDSNNSKRRLAILLGLSAPAETLSLTEPLPSPPESTISVAQMLEIATSTSFDLRAAEAAVEEAVFRVQDEYRKVFPNIEIGLAFERTDSRALPGRNILADTARASVANGALTAPEIESRGQRNIERRQIIDSLLGPTVQLTVPIFDQNQAQIAKARYQLEQAEKTRVSVERALIQNVRRAVDSAETAWEVARLYEKELVPQAQTTLELSRESYRAGRTSLIVVLEAQRDLLEVRQAGVAALQNAALAVAELERLIARPLASLIETTTRPSAPSTSRENKVNGGHVP